MTENDHKPALLEFLKSQKLIAVASHQNSDIWVANVYYGIDDTFKIYFISPSDAKHSQQILASPGVAFSTAWFNPVNHKDRKAVQGLGVCRRANSEQETAIGVALHNKNFPEFAGKITVDWINTNEYQSRVWVIEPSYIKYWDDELYGAEETEEFDL